MPRFLQKWSDVKVFRDHHEKLGVERDRLTIYLVSKETRIDTKFLE